jgi:hypothetical protein
MASPFPPDFTRFSLFAPILQTYPYNDLIAKALSINLHASLYACEVYNHKYL